MKLKFQVQESSSQLWLRQVAILHKAFGTKERINNPCSQIGSRVSSGRRFINPVHEVPLVTNVKRYAACPQIANQIVGLRVNRPIGGVNQ